MSVQIAELWQADARGDHVVTAVDGDASVRVTPTSGVERIGPWDERTRREPFATADVVDASVVLVARVVNGVAVTSDADDLRRLDPGIDLVPW